MANNLGKGNTKREYSMSQLNKHKAKGAAKYAKKHYPKAKTGGKSTTYGTTHKRYKF